MRVGILADVHANLDALQAVLDDGERGRGINRWWFVGDAVGYGPQPVETLLLLREHVDTRHWIIGNHDAWLVKLPRISDIMPRAAETLLDHRRGIRAYRDDGQSSRLWEWCRHAWTQERAQPRRLPVNGIDCWLSHARLLVKPWPDCIEAYVFPWPNLDAPDRRPETFEALRGCRNGKLSSVLIHGHTHVPHMLVWQWDSNKWTTWPICYGKPELLHNFEAVILSPGSVGQPRNPDPQVHAAYGILDTEESTFEFRRAPYDSRPMRLAMPGHYDLSLTWWLEGAHPDNPLWAPNNWLWLEWERTYAWQEGCWEPIDPNANEPSANGLHVLPNS